MREAGESGVLYGKEKSPLRGTTCSTGRARDLRVRKCALLTQRCAQIGSVANVLTSLFLCHQTDLPIFSIM
ncbi:hypothetical protein Y032_0007g3239 [Ancylostoma ceylanicum]|uniref:Uncharacterized protein n=1 Tax=Ancylostoma ceylanicum TaxID=53326 RepID=A0A016VNX8_9BILA|nr:hypothetical protein Y032_0007g3239 [Ancylostoma ceylanicum]